MKVTAAIPYWESDIGKREILNKCLSSLKGHDEVIVVAGKQKNLPTAWNMCLEYSFGSGADYVVLANDDIELLTGTLDMLCIPDTVVSPAVNGGFFKDFHCHIFAMPKNIWEQIGAFDEQFTIYWADTDYAQRIVNLGIKHVTMPEVNVSHPEPARTLKHEPRKLEQEDREKFYAKWGHNNPAPL